ncbi:hypothetical protein ACD591_10270 [Rufibacter glacialis]|uniref:Uncharacterized protein n=1 Tax=Rufibacter glacialis TaxID=1259555 RepID=A0A5M8Q7H6_9BACT|nr:hypothetical protein [Rufibacter glacialis]KAA6431849.1 hypothetical protein FOE74_17210 [Rufibacter glacialis]GGK81022.1 hypothetical protein GCM10011405_31000 [Rufibacter glacialis]
MNFSITIHSAETLEEVPGYWSDQDYIQLLEKFNFPDAASASPESLPELLAMAITDFEPNEAAALVLEYKLSDSLGEGQIQQISNDMLLDKISEEYPVISLHAPLFHINQLLYKAFNGKFPNTKATRIQFTALPQDQSQNASLSKEGALRLLEQGLSDSNLVKRLFGEQMAGTVAFPEADAIVWELQTSGDHTYSLLTSEYWINKEEVVTQEFEGTYEESTAPQEAA